MVFLLLALDDHVINVGLHIPSKLLSEDGVYTSLEGSRGISQTKRHYLVTIQPIVSDKGCFVLVFLLKRNLMKSRIGINEAHGLVPCCRVY
jgi:hypothetical protein